MRSRSNTRAESLVDVALPLHFKYPNLQDHSGPDGEVSVVTGSHKSGSKPFLTELRQAGLLKRHPFADALPGTCWQRIDAVGV